MAAKLWRAVVTTPLRSDDHLQDDAGQGGEGGPGSDLGGGREGEGRGGDGGVHAGMAGRIGGSSPNSFPEHVLLPWKEGFNTTGPRHRERESHTLGEPWV